MFFTEGWTKWSVSSIAFWVVLPQASLTSFPFLWSRVGVHGGTLEGDDPFCDLPAPSTHEDI